ncbi:MAG: hypothetical protein ABI210_08485 [Abditibacteriaceae bacterium]
MELEKPLFKCAGCMRMGDSFFSCLDGWSEVIRVFHDRLELGCDPWQKHVFLLEDIKAIKIVTILGQKFGTVIKHNSSNEPSYVQFDSLIKKRIMNLLCALETEGYPIDRNS